MTNLELRVQTYLNGVDWDAVGSELRSHPSVLPPMTNHYPDHCDQCGTELMPGDGELIPITGHRLMVVCREH